MEIEKITINTCLTRNIVQTLSEGQCQSDRVIELEAGAKMHYVQVNELSSSAQSSLIFNLAAGASLHLNVLDLGVGEFVRNIQVNLLGSASRVQVDGLYLVGTQQKITNNLKINHLVEDCESSQMFKGVVSGESSFSGHIYIERNAQRSVALQENHNILLHDGAKALTHPWLEIYADDVKCSHGATVGKNDDQAIYYLRQRGISPREARTLLLEGFINACVSEFEGREVVLEKLRTRLKGL